MLRILMFFKFYFIFYCVLVRVTVYVGCLSGVINDDKTTELILTSYLNVLLPRRFVFAKCRCSATVSIGLVSVARLVVGRG